MNEKKNTMIVKIFIGIVSFATLYYAYANRKVIKSLIIGKENSKKATTEKKENLTSLKWNNNGSLREQLLEAADKLWENYISLEDAKNTEATIKELIYSNSILHYGYEAKNILLSDDEECNKSRLLLHHVSNELFNVATMYLKRNQKNLWVLRLSNKYQIGHDTLLYYAGYDTNVAVEDIKDIDKVIEKLRSEALKYRIEKEQLTNSKAYNRYLKIYKKLIPSTMDFATLTEQEPEPEDAIILERAKKYCDSIEKVNKQYLIITEEE